MAATQLTPRAMGRVVGVFAGGPETRHDAQGEWRSSMAVRRRGETWRRH